MKAFIYVIIWTLLFVIFGVYTNIEINKFTDKYSQKIDIIAVYIEEDNWSKAKDSLKDYHEIWHEERIGWYKLLNHDYFDCICLQIELLDRNILVQDKSKALEKIELIKSNLDNILDAEKCDSSHIF